jgi:hypothetical protein
MMWLIVISQNARTGGFAVEDGDSALCLSLRQRAIAGNPIGACHPRGTRTTPEELPRGVELNAAPSPAAAQRP